MATIQKGKKGWEKLYIVVDEEGYPLEEFKQIRDAFRFKRKDEKSAGKQRFVAQLVEVADKSEPEAVPELLVE